MRIWVYNYHQWKNQNSSMFENPKIAIWDDLMKPFQVLKQYFKNRWHELSSIADYPIKDFDAIIFIEYPTLPFLINPYFKKCLKLKKRLFLLLMESEIIRPSNFKKQNHKYFEKIFTWKDSIVDNKKYIKFCIPQNIPENFTLHNKKRKLCTLISSHKLHNHPYELYSERVRAIRYCEENNIDFDLYGMWWDRFTFRHKLINTFGPLFPWFKYIKNIFHNLSFKRFPSWKWKVDSKNETLSQYKFAISYENARSIPGYITEKIFDCFFAWCIPIYLWAPNIDNFIPKNTYIDKNDFTSYKELYEYIIHMPKNEYENYKTNIKKFLTSKKIKKFSSEEFSTILYKNIISYET